MLQIVVAFVLLTGASLLVESFERYRRVDPGFRPERRVGVRRSRCLLARCATLTTRSSGYMRRERSSCSRRCLASRGQARAHGVPGIGGDVATFRIVGDPRLQARTRGADCLLPLLVSAELLRGQWGTDCVRGRGVLASNDSRSTKVAVIDELLARRFLAGRDPLGRLITFCCHEARHCSKSWGSSRRSRKQGLLGSRRAAHLRTIRAAVPRSACCYVEVRTAADPERDSPRACGT